MKLRVGPKLLSIREERKMTQAEFAELLSMSQSAYCRLEKGDSMADLEQIIRFSEILDVPVADFMPEFNVYHNGNHNGHGHGHGGIIIGNLTVYSSPDEMAKAIESEKGQLALTVEHQREMLRAKDELIDALRREIELLRGGGGPAS